MDVALRSTADRHETNHLHNLLDFQSAGFQNYEIAIKFETCSLLIEKKIERLSDRQYSESLVNMHVDITFNAHTI